MNILDRSSSSDVRKEAGERTKGIHYTYVALSNTMIAIFMTAVNGGII